MTHLHWMAFRMYLPTLACLALAFGSTWWLAGAGPSAFRLPLGDPLRWTPYGLLGLAALLGIIASVRLSRRDTRDTLICRCGGLLGQGHQRRHGRYRTCTACGRHHAMER